MSLINLPTLRQLRYLVALDERRHFARAAADCFVTQSTLSAGIKELETQLGAILVERTKRSVALTPLGSEVVARARLALAEAEEIARIAEAAGPPLAGPLRLGVIPTIGPFALPRALPALRRAYPDLKLFLREDLTARLVAGLEAGDLDAALLALPCDCGPSETMALMKDPFSLVCLPGHPLAKFATVPEDALRGAPLMLLEDGHCLRDQALAACGLARPNDEAQAFGATSLHTLVQMAANGLGVTLLPKIALDAGLLKGTPLVARPLAGTGAARTIGLAWRRGARRRPEYELLGTGLVEALTGRLRPRTAPARPRRSSAH